jgi:hypothetical protein
MFVRWRDASEFFADELFSQSLIIRLRKGARPGASSWTRIMNAWPRNTFVVSMWTTVARPAEIAEALSTVRARYGAT